MRRRLVVVMGVCMLAGLVELTLQGQPPPPQPQKKPGTEEPRGPRLGVGFDMRREGALITFVAKDSAAAAAGVEPGDLVIKVDGYTVGFVEGMMFPLNSEIRRIKGTGSFEIKTRSGKIVTKEIAPKAPAAPPPPPDQPKPK